MGAGRQAMSRNRWTFIAEISATPYDFVLEDLLWWTMENLQKAIVISYFIYYQAYVPININISSYIYTIANANSF